MIIVPELDPLPDFALIGHKETAEVVIPPKPIKRRRGKKFSQQELQSRIDILNKILSSPLSTSDKSYYESLKNRYESMITEKNFIVMPSENVEIPRFVNKVYQPQQHDNVYNLINSQNYQSMITTISDIHKMVSMLLIVRDFERPLYMNSIQVPDNSVNDLKSYYEQILKYCNSDIN
jgi:hypothetical protein